MDRAMGPQAVWLSRAERPAFGHASATHARPDAGAHDRLSSRQRLLDHRRCTREIDRYDNGVFATRGRDDGDALGFGRSWIVALPPGALRRQRRGAAGRAFESLWPPWGVWCVR